MYILKRVADTELHENLIKVKLYNIHKQAAIKKLFSLIFKLIV
jgi:hypothetical protein